ncbi:nuclear transport factor 2 family protein, partial [Olivibacter sp. CPCC 100613]|uniref:nuclear transport factor 2 family protein n=1 Tax=Olivibacter sp. CPCC 100613 TaxID=3079931 RepID=UPI002FF5AB79
SVKWNQPGANRFSGLKQSSNEVFEMVGGMFEISRNTLSLAAIQTIAINGNQASVLLRWTAGQPGDGLDVENVDVYTVKDGKIVEVTVYSADLKHENAFWGK